MSISVDQIIDQLNKARSLALSDKDLFPNIIRQILPICKNPELRVQEWCSRLLIEFFYTDDSVIPSNLKMDISIDCLDYLVQLSKERHATLFKNCVRIAIIVFKLVFRFIVENPQNTADWIKLNELKNVLMMNFVGSFPFPPGNDEHNSLTSLDVKMALLPFLITVIEYESVGPQRTDNRSRSSSQTVGFSLSSVPSDHLLIKRSIEAEANGLVELLIKNIDSEIMVVPMITATLNQLSFLIKRRPQFQNKVMEFVKNYDTNSKLRSNYESLETYKLSKKFVDRAFRSFINYSTRANLIPQNHSSALARKLETLVDRGDGVRRKNILSSSPEDSKIAKKKLVGFYNSSTKVKTSDYKDLYTLIDPSTDISKFDVSALPADILTTLTLIALSKADVNTLTSALGIVSQRYLYGINSQLPEPDATDSSQEATPAPALVASSGANGSNNQLKISEDSDYEDEDVNADFNPETIYTLPEPEVKSFAEKKNHINLIVENFFKLAESKDKDSLTNLPLVDGERDQEEVNSDLNKIAITNWKKDSWLVLLTRLASRGMRSIDAPYTVDGDDSTEDMKEKEQLSDLIRNAIFNYFLENIQARIDLIIEWLNEEWYSEKIFNEEKIYEELRDKYLEEAKTNLKSEDLTTPETDDINSKVQQELSKTAIPTPIYIVWSGKVLDAMIPFLEPNDRKIFIRLLSDLPYLNEELVMRVKSLCLDPGRSKIGFQSLQFLIMFRPPVKKICMDILENLLENEDLKADAEALLNKYK